MTVSTKDLSVAVVRLVAGSIIIGHGYTKLFGGNEKKAPKFLNRFYGKNFPEAVEKGGPEAFAGALTHMNFPAPDKAAYAAGIAEFAGGVGIALGLGTRASGLALAGTMIGAANAHKATGLFGQGGSEFPVLLGTVAAAIALSGPGSLSVDALLKSRG